MDNIKELTNVMNSLQPFLKMAGKDGEIKTIEFVEIEISEEVSIKLDIKKNSTFDLKNKINDIVVNHSVKFPRCFHLQKFIDGIDKKEKAKLTKEKQTEYEGITAGELIDYVKTAKKCDYTLQEITVSQFDNENYVDKYDLLAKFERDIEIFKLCIDRKAAAYKSLNENDKTLLYSEAKSSFWKKQNEDEIQKVVSFFRAKVH